MCWRQGESNDRLTEYVWFHCVPYDWCTMLSVWGQEIRNEEKCKCVRRRGRSCAANDLRSHRALDGIECIVRLQLCLPIGQVLSFGPHCFVMDGRCRLVGTTFETYSGNRFDQSTQPFPTAPSLACVGDEWLCWATGKAGRLCTAVSEEWGKHNSGKSGLGRPKGPRDRSSSASHLNFHCLVIHFGLSEQV